MFYKLKKSFSKLISILGFLVAILSIFGGANIPVVAANSPTLNDFNLLTVNCFFPGQPNCDASAGNIFDILLGFGLGLAPFLAIIVIMWGGYKYLFSGLPGSKEDGLKSVQSGVIGLIIVLIASAIVTIIRGTFTSSGLSIDPLRNQINNISDFLFALVGVVAVAIIIWGGYQYLFSGLPGGKEEGLKTIQNGVIGLVIVLVAKPFAGIVQATFGTGTSGQLTLSTDSIVNTIKYILTTFAIPLSSVITIALFVYGAYLILTAGGDDTKVKDGRKALTNATIGLVIVLLATTIVQLITQFVPSSATNPSSSSTNSIPTITTIPNGGTTTNPNGGTTTNPNGGTTTNPNGGTTTNPTKPKKPLPEENKREPVIGTTYPVSFNRYTCNPDAATQVFAPCISLGLRANDALDIYNNCLRTNADNTSACASDRALYSQILQSSRGASTATYQ